MRTHLRLVFSALVVGLVAIPFWAFAREEHEHASHFTECSKVCANCARECQTMYTHCGKLVESGKKEHAASMRMSADCAEFCELAAKLTARGGPLAYTACEACAISCDACAAECEKFPSSKEMAACAKVCRECAKSCREMVKHRDHKK